MECDKKCGCAVPCPGGTECRCTSRTAGGQREHTTYQCGEHCECAPCTCGRAMMPSGREGRRANCSCGAACGCASCASTSA